MKDFSFPGWALLLFGLVLILVFFPLIKALLWRFFSFDRRIDKLLQQKKSSEVRLGKITEIMSPLLEDFPVDVHKPGTATVFIGQPIDYIHFDPDEGVTFIEVKSGDSRLSQSQKAIKAHIEAGNVTWAQYRLRGK